MNQVNLIGHLGKDPEFKQLDNSKVCTASIATSEKYKTKSGEVKEVTDWHNLVFWNRQAEVISDWAKKGTRLEVTGKLKSRSYEKKDGTKGYITEVYVTSFEFLGGTKQKEQQSEPHDEYPIPDGTDDLPF